MNLFNAYSRWNVEPIKGRDCYLFDETGKKYLDLYGGHGVISVGHCRPSYIKSVANQLHRLGFYSNSVKNTLQQRLAQKLGEQSGYRDYSLFLCNSGAEANENAIKLASISNGREKVLAFKHSFHGRTSGAAAVTDNAKILSPFNKTDKVVFVPMGDISLVDRQLSKDEFCAVIIEPIQGLGGVWAADDEFLKNLSHICNIRGVMLIADEVQCGYGRTGSFFAHQWSGIKPDLITVAKGMANGFPMGGVLISPNIKHIEGFLGSSFGGNHLGCAAALAVLDVFETENVVENAADAGDYLLARLRDNPYIKDVRGRGLMIGIELRYPVEGVRKTLLYDHNIFTGVSGDNTIRLTPPLCIKKRQISDFVKVFSKVLLNININNLQ